MILANSSEFTKSTEASEFSSEGINFLPTFEVSLKDRNFVASQEPLLNRNIKFSNAFSNSNTHYNNSLQPPLKDNVTTEVQTFSTASSNEYLKGSLPSPTERIPQTGNLLVTGKIELIRYYKN